VTLLCGSSFYYYYYKICIAHKFKHARVGNGVAGWENGLAGEGKNTRCILVFHFSIMHFLRAEQETA